MTILRFCSIFTFFLLLQSPAEAIWWLFGDDRNDASPQVQSEKARPFYDRAVKADKAGKDSRAARLYKKVFKKYPAANTAGDSLFNYALIHFEKHNWKKSFEAFQTVLIRHPEYPRFNEIVEYQFRISLSLAEGDHTRFLFVFPSRALNRSAAYFNVITVNAPYSRLAPLALMNKALIHQYKGEIAQSIDALDRLINNYPTSLLADDAYLALAETFATLVQGPLYDQGATREAMSYFEDFLILYSENEKIAQAEEGLAEMKDVYARSKLVIGQYYFKHRRWYGAAEIFLNEAITTAPNSSAAGEAQALLDRIASIREQYQAEGGSAPQSEEERSFIARILGVFGIG